VNKLILLENKPIRGYNCANVLKEFKQNINRLCTTRHGDKQFCEVLYVNVPALQVERNL
jgi:hypothetical protein